MKRLCCIFFLIVGVFHTKAQDTQFSQFNEHHSLLNPALIGANDNLRIVGGQRNQWKAAGSPFSTYGLGVEVRPPGRKKKTAGRYSSRRGKKVGMLGGGLSVYSDNSADGTFKQLQANLALATYVPTGEKSFFSAAVQGGFSQYTIDGGNLLYPSQFDGKGYSSSATSGETWGGRTLNTNDLAAGIIWSYGHNVRGFTDQREVKFKIGFAAYHLLPTNLYYINRSKNVLLPRYCGHLEVIHSLGNMNYSLASTLMYQMQGPYTQITGGSMLRFYSRHDTKYTGNLKRTTVGFGLYYRVKDALISTLLIEWHEQFSTGISYDISMSKMRYATYRGGLEISLRYNPPGAFLYQRR